MRWRDHPLYSELLFLTNNDYFPQWDEDEKHVKEVQKLISVIDAEEYKIIKSGKFKRKPKIVLYKVKRPDGEEQVCFSAREAAAFLGVSDNTIRYYSKHGVGKTSPNYGAEVRKLDGDNV
ncbi:MerR family transcriptional regulator [Ignavigranum ruoffiae]|uniref:MerR family transcriptional regulator n=1 Tax=Ignavigranum ruoffiae TaxID=89093 RepID=UPI00235472A7|nr:hypothetical protein [Ignavigranum ruoffiae]